MRLILMVVIVAIIGLFVFNNNTGFKDPKDKGLVHKVVVIN